ncbi:hypothetical protein MNBD_NITROSPINAE03-1392 [hydrothermal vent metagenome]|uniref:Uncharacterized protein n=1 Tax=hydrothermal vent metagenome TaxID=652676 RepID=A0A3B1BKU3_9ZZZZ
MAFHILADNSRRFFGRCVVLNGVYAAKPAYESGAFDNETVILSISPAPNLTQRLKGEAILDRPCGPSSIALIHQSEERN